MEKKTKKLSLGQTILQDLSSRTEQWLFPFSILLAELGKVDILITIGRLFLAVPGLILVGAIVLAASPVQVLYTHLSDKLLTAIGYRSSEEINDLELGDGNKVTASLPEESLDTISEPAKKKEDSENTLLSPHSETTVNHASDESAPRPDTKNRRRT